MFRLILCIAVFALAPQAAGQAIQSAKSGPWTDPQTWVGRSVPGAGADVVILPGHRVVYGLESDEPIRSIHVAGTLSFAPDRDTRLTVGLLLIRALEAGADDFTVEPDAGHGHAGHHGQHGAGERNGLAEMPALELGTPDRPVDSGHRAVIRLAHFEGTDPATHPALVAYGGRVEIHGAPMSRTWVKLARTARPGDRQVTLAEPVTGWNVGDRVIVPTTAMLSLFDSKARRVIPSVREDSQTEERTIAAIDGATITLDEPLEHEHLVDGAFAGEVANLSRNVVIESADPDGVRGHTMYHHGSLGSISYAEFRHLGKEGLLGRYSLHFHMCGDSMRGSSVIGASIWDSDNRWITVHGTNFLVVRDVVGYRSIGHGFFLEDGTEVYNSFDRNLAVQAANGAVPEGQILPFDHNDGAGFWWANSLNSFTRNVAVECDQYGYRYEMRPLEAFEPMLPVRQPDGSHKVVDVRTLPFIRFDDNEARSQRRYGLNLGGIRSVARQSDYVNDEGVTDVRTLDQELIRGGDVGGVGPDARHPFVVRDLKVWKSHWAYHSGTPSVFVDGLDVLDSNYGIWRSNSDLAEFRDTTFRDIRRVEIFYPWGGNNSIQDDYDKLLRPRDDLPPASVITRVVRDPSGRLIVTGTTIDNGRVSEVLVNGLPAEALDENYLQWRIALDGSEAGASTLTAVATDDSGNREQSPAVVQVPAKQEHDRHAGAHHGGGM